MTLRLQVFHQDELFVDALSAVLAADGFEVIDTASLPELVRAASTADAVLIDMRADGAPDAIRALAELSPRLRVLGCIEGSDPRQVAALRKAGAIGWISTADGFDRLVHLLRRPVGSIAAGTATDRRAARAATTTRDQHRLTAREAEVLDGLAGGTSTDALAASLHVSPATARTHVHNVLAKLGVHTRLEAVAYAIEHQLVHVGDLADRTGGQSHA